MSFQKSSPLHPETRRIAPREPRNEHVLTNLNVATCHFCLNNSLVRNASTSSSREVRRRLIDILGMQADEDALASLLHMSQIDSADREHIQRAIQNIEAFTPQTKSKPEAIQRR